MKNPAREKFLPMLSPYVDGELTPEERQLVEQHLSNNKDSAAQVADFRAGDAIIRHALEMQADTLDWKSFTDDVMSKVTPEKLPFFQRLSLSLSEMFTYQRGPLVAGFVGAAAAIVIGVPVSLKLLGTPDGYGGTKLHVQTVSVEDPAVVTPLIMETESGDSIIWVMDNPDGGKKKKGGDHDEETLTEEGNQGEL